jgi:hypothetical protein
MAESEAEPELEPHPADTSRAATIEDAAKQRESQVVVVMYISLRQMPIDESLVSVSKPRPLRSPPRGSASENRLRVSGTYLGSVELASLGALS